MLIGVVFAEFMQFIETVAFIYRLFDPITTIIGSNLHYLIDISLIKGNRENAIQYLSLLYLLYFGLSILLFVSAVRHMQFHHVVAYPTEVRQYYRFLCSTLYRWAPLLFPQGPTCSIYLAVSREDGNQTRSTFAQAIRNYAKSTHLWVLYGLGFFVFFYFLPKQDVSFINGILLRIPIGFSFTSVILVSVQATLLTEIFVLLSSFVTKNRERR